MGGRAAPMVLVIDSVSPIRRFVRQHTFHFLDVSWEEGFFFGDPTGRLGNRWCRTAL